MINALQGFSNLYHKIAVFKRVEAQHELRVEDLHHSDPAIVIRIAEYVLEHHEQIAQGGWIASASAVLVIARELIQTTKHQHGRPVQRAVVGKDGNATIVNAQGGNFSIHVDTLNIYQRGIVAGDLGKMVAPLKPGKVDGMEFSFTYPNGKGTESVAAEDRDSFYSGRSQTVSNARIFLEGEFDSLSKSRHGGSFYLKDGGRVRYRFAEENLYEFFLYSGPVRVECEAKIGEDKKPFSITIYSVEPLQGDLFSGTG
jgi:hypothetical protein